MMTMTMLVAQGPYYESQSLRLVRAYRQVVLSLPVWGQWKMPYAGLV